MTYNFNLGSLLALENGIEMFINFLDSKASYLGLTVH
jgi:hypothetical protein